MSGKRRTPSYAFLGGALLALLGPVASAQLVRVVPIVLDVDNGSAHYTTELTFTNDEPSPTSVAMTYTPSMGSKSGGGTVTETLGAGEQRRIPDVLVYLRSKGLPLPPGSDEPSQGGTLRLFFFMGDALDANRVTALARTTAETAAPLPSGRSGFAYAAALLTDASSSAFVGGLRSNETDRSNLAVVNFSDQPATFGITVQDLTRDHRPDLRSVIVRDKQVLPPWGWAQVNSAELLDAAGIRDGLGLVSASAPVYVYGVINDRITNDASFLRPLHLPLEAVFIPVVESSGFVTELTLSDEGRHPAVFSLEYVESLGRAFGTGGKNGLFGVAEFEQAIVPNAIDMLRQTPPIVIGPPGAASYGGVLWAVHFMDGFVTSRTLTRPTSPNDGRFGFAPPEIRISDAASDRAAVYGLVSDDENRTNVAVMHIGDPMSDGPVTLLLQVHDGTQGGPAKGDPIVLTLAPREWSQINGILRGAGVTEGWVEITRLSGSAPWYAYGVINDGAYPGERTGDGSYVAMTK